MKRTTEFSPCRRYRYTLWREWDEDILARTTGARPDEYLMVIGLNPSTADETCDDPTIRKCVGFAKRWGYGALCMTNLFAFRATDPKVMKRELGPIGPDNDEWLARIARGAGMILAAWGAHGSHLKRDAEVCQLLEGRSMSVLKLNKDMSPMHPLYVSYEISPITQELP